MLRPGQTAEAQHTMVSNVLAGLMTPVLPPIYKTFMTGELSLQNFWQSFHCVRCNTGSFAFHCIERGPWIFHSLKSHFLQCNTKPSSIISELRCVGQSLPSSKISIVSSAGGRVQCQ